MRKSLTLTLLLLILAASAFGYIHASIDERKDAVTIDETVLYGDKSIAKGITLDFNIHSNYRLFWDTSYTVGDSPKLNTTFTFSQVQRQPERPGPAFEIHLNGLHSGGSTSAGSLDMEAEHIPLPIRDVATRTQPGKKHTETVFIKDYYDFYPLLVSFEWPTGFAVNQDTLNLFASYLRIPAHAEHQVEISVNKDTVGNVNFIETSKISGTEVYSHATSVVTASHCFFTFSCYTTDGELLDTSNIPGGYGIYRFPRHTESGVHNLTADELQTVYSLDAERVRVEALYTSKDQGQLLLVTSEDGAYMLTVIDAVTLTELQKLRLIDTDIASGWQPFRFRNLHVYEDFLVAVGDDNKFALLTLNAEDYYEVQFEASLSTLKGREHIFSYDPVMAYNGKQLAVAAFQAGYYQPWNYCSFYLAVYTEAGMIYAGDYQHSLGKDMIHQDDYELICRPLEGEPLRVTWGD